MGSTSHSFNNTFYSCCLEFDTVKNPEVLVGPTGFEPVTSRVSVGCSNQAKPRARDFATRLGNLRMHVIFSKNLLEICAIMTLFFYRGFELVNGRYFRHVTQRFIG